MNDLTSFIVFVVWNSVIPLALLSREFISSTNISCPNSLIWSWKHLHFFFFLIKSSWFWKFYVNYVVSVQNICRKYLDHQYKLIVICMIIAKMLRLISFEIFLKPWESLVNVNKPIIDVDANLYWSLTGILKNPLFKSNDVKYFEPSKLLISLSSGVWGIGRVLLYR